MINELNELEKLKVLRTIIGEYEKDEFGMPVIRNSFQNAADSNFSEFESIILQNYKNISPDADNSNTIAIMFKYDNVLMSLWNDPLKRVGLFSSCFGISSPDFSVYPNMAENEIRHNVFKNRWLGVQWQNYGCRVFPCLSWAGEDTYDICFSGVEKGCIPIISTLGVKKNPEMFLRGFYEMKKRLAPPLVIVLGDYIEGMTGRFLFGKYKESFSKYKTYSEKTLFEMSRIVEISENKGDNYGW